MEISRRNLILTSGAAAAFPSAVFAAPNLPEYVAWPNESQAGHTTLRDKFGAQGYRTTSLCVYGEPDQSLYAAVMVKRQIVHPEWQFVGLDILSLLKERSAMANKGFYPFIVSGTGSSENARYAVSFRPMSKPSKLAFLTGKQLIDENEKAFDEQRRLMWVDALGTPGKINYCAIWSGEESQDAWNHNTTRIKAEDMRAVYLAMKKVGAHPELIAVTPDGRYLPYYTDGDIGDVSFRGEMSVTAYKKEANAHKMGGYFPYRISASGSGSKTKFAAVFAQRESIEPRVFRSSGSPSISGIDDLIRNFMEKHGLRGASLAIVDKKQLVYAKGYTYAEPSYPEVTPSTYFRVASVSKFITALALFRFMELASSDGGFLRLDTRIQSFLGLKQPNGKAPADERFDDITIEHLLDASAGLEKKYYHRHSVQAAKAFKKPLPATPTQIARYLTREKLKHAPGDLSGVTYGRTAYFMLALLLTKLMNKADFESALKVLVMEPAGITRLRNSRTLIDDQLAGEARYHMPNLALAKSVRSDDRPLSPYQYGSLDYEAVGGPGGLSIAMPDLARLGAILSDEEGNSFLSKDNRLNYFRRVITQKKAISDAGGTSGVSGFGGISEASSSPGHFEFTKGGGLEGNRSRIVVNTNGYTIAFAYNGDPRPGVKTNWRNPLETLLASGSISWPPGDLFPQFGISSL